MFYVWTKTKTRQTNETVLGGVRHSLTKNNETGGENRTEDQVMATGGAVRTLGRQRERQTGDARARADRRRLQRRRGRPTLR